MTDKPARIRREIARTRERMTETIDEIDGEISERVTLIKRRVDPIQLAREHPWPALGVAVAIGALIGRSGADKRAAAATANAAKRLGSASSQATKKVAGKFQRPRDTRRALHDEGRMPREMPDVGASGRSLGERLFDAATSPLAMAFDRILDEMRAASRDLGARLARSGHGTSGASTPDDTPVQVIVEERPVPRAEDVVPVPAEMLPTEVDARADAVEALGGGTHEPPLEPGAGDLGARWA